MTNRATLLRTFLPGLELGGLEAVVRRLEGGVVAEAAPSGGGLEEAALLARLATLTSRMENTVGIA